MKKSKGYKFKQGPKVKITHKLKKNIIPKITVPVKTKGRPKGSKNKKAETIAVTPDIQAKIDKIDATLAARSAAPLRLAESEPVPEGSGNERVEVEVDVIVMDVPKSGPVSDNAPEQLPDFLEIVDGQSYFASNKGRLTNQEIIDNRLEFDRVIGNVWHYKFK